MRLRNKSPAFAGELEIADTPPHVLRLAWRHAGCEAMLTADLHDHSFSVSHRNGGAEEGTLSFP
jgi:sucrose phosphorylase